MKMLIRVIDRPSSELPPLPDGIKGYRGVHMYTLLQIVITAGIFAITFTPAAPAFPVIIVLLVPIRLRVMNKWWNRETLKRLCPFVLVATSYVLKYPIQP